MERIGDKSGYVKLPDEQPTAGPVQAPRLSQVAPSAWAARAADRPERAPSALSRLRKWLNKRRDPGAEVDAKSPLRAPLLRDGKEAPRSQPPAAAWTGVPAAAGAPHDLKSRPAAQAGIGARIEQERSYSGLQALLPAGAHVNAYTLELAHKAFNYALTLGVGRQVLGGDEAAWAPFREEVTRIIAIYLHRVPIQRETGLQAEAGARWDAFLAFARQRDREFGTHVARAAECIAACDKFMQRSLALRQLADTCLDRPRADELDHTLDGVELDVGVIQGELREGVFEALAMFEEAIEASPQDPPAAAGPEPKAKPDPRAAQQFRAFRNHLDELILAVEASPAPHSHHFRKWCSGLVQVAAFNNGVLSAQGK